MGKRWSWSQAHFNVYVHVFVYICLALKPEPTQTLSKKDGEVNIYLHMGIRSQDRELGTQGSTPLMDDNSGLFNVSEVQLER